MSANEFDLDVHCPGLVVAGIGYEVIKRAIVQLTAAAGGGSGVIEGLAVSAQGTPDMTVSVAAGSGVADGALTGLEAAANSAAFVAPTTNPVIAIVQIEDDGTIDLKYGTEAGSPTAPTADSGKLLLAEVYLRVGSTSVKNSDDATNGYITDAREFV